MPRSPLVNLTAAALLFACATPRKSPVPGNAIDLQFSPLTVQDAASVEGVRLLSADSPQTLAMIRHSREGAPDVSMGAIEGGHLGSAREIFQLSSPFGAPSWDVAPTAAGTAATWTRPGSAIAPLIYRVAGANELTLSARYQMGVFENPRFVRGDGGAVTAIALDGADKRIVLFRDALGEGQAATYVKLPSPGDGTPVQAVLSKRGGGYLLCATLLPRGERIPERTDRRGESLQPGILRCAILNSSLQQLGPSLAPIGDTQVYEIDLDATGHRACLLATTREGYTAAAGTGSERLAWSTTRGTDNRELTSPAVLAAGESALAAVIAATPPRVQILVGKF